MTAGDDKKPPRRPKKKPQRKRKKKKPIPRDASDDLRRQFPALVKITEDREEPKVGRPREYDPAYCLMVIQWGDMGKSLVWMAARLGVTRETLHAWRRDFPEFSDALAIAKGLCQAWWEDAGQHGMLTQGFNAAIWNKNMAARFREDWSDVSIQERHYSMDFSNMPDDVLKQYVEAGRNFFGRIPGLAKSRG